MVQGAKVTDLVLSLAVLQPSNRLTPVLRHFGNHLVENGPGMPLDNSKTISSGLPVIAAGKCPGARRCWNRCVGAAVVVGSLVARRAQRNLR